MKKIALIAAVIIFTCFGANAQGTELQFSKSAKTADGTTEFKSGDFIYAHLKFAQPIASMLTLNDRPVTFLTEFHSKGKLMEEEMYGFDAAKVKGAKQTSIVLPIVSDPAGDVPAFGKNMFAIRLPAALAALPEGSHEIEFKAKSYNYKDAAEPFATGKFTLVIVPGANAWYKKNEKDSYDAMTKRGVTTVIASERDVAMGVVGGTDVVTLVNNCGRSVWMRKASGSDKREYRLAPGQEMKYDRDGRYLEEWNFGTKKWNMVTRVFSTGPDGKANICK
jgi:hypothetical protein